MFATPTSYSLTPSRSTPGHFARLPERATTILRDVRRRSQRLRRTCSFQQKLLTATPGTFVQLGEDEVREKYIEEVQQRARKVRRLNDSSALVLTPLPVDVNRNSPAAQATHSLHKDTLSTLKRGTNPGQASSLSRRCSSFFTPNSRREAWQRSSCRISSSVRNLGSTFEKQAEEGKERLKPIRQGYMYKKSKSSRLFRRKYITLTSDSMLTYYSSFQAYIDNMGGKQIDLGHVTVKVPGRRPQGSEEELEEEEGRKRRRVSDENMNTTMLEMNIVSLNGQVWQFQVCSARELEAWTQHIQELIRSSLLQGEAPQFEDRLGAVREANSSCADCDARDPDWASLNLGVVVCIECSGIHRKLGTHVTKVRSLSLDTWTEVHVRILELLGNTTVNSVLEEDIAYTTATKPATTTARRDKEKYILEKYVGKAFMAPVEEAVEEAPLVEVLQAAVREGDMRQVVRVVAGRRVELEELLRREEEVISEVVGEEGEYAVRQLLIWVRGEEGEGESSML